MPFGVFLHRTDSIYDDSPAERYQFPRQYLERVKAFVGDWIVYLEPTNALTHTDDAGNLSSLARIEAVAAVQTNGRGSAFRSAR